MFDPKVHVGAAARVLREIDGKTEVLLLKRGPNATHGANTWGLPGGWIDWGQTPEEAAARELMEEINVAVYPDHGAVIGTAANTYPDEDMHVICVAVHFDNYDASRIINMEPEKCDEVKWINVDALATMALFPPLETFAKAWGWI